MAKVTDRARQHIAAGTGVSPGIYRCNACANQYESSTEGEKLPRCQVCDSISWRTYRRTAGPIEKKADH